MSEQQGSAAELIEGFIRERFSVAPDDEFFDQGVHLFEEGYVDSTGVVELVAFLEERFSVRLPDDALFDPDFTTVEGLARLVARLEAA